MVKVSSFIKKQIIELKLFESDKGRIKGLVVCNRGKKSNAKSYYISDDIYKNYLRRIKNSK